MLKLALATLAAVLATAVPAWGQAPAAGLDSMISAFAREKGFNGTILVQDGGRVRFHRSFGVAERAFGTPADTSTRYKVASITKLFTSVLVLQLAQEGKVRLDAPIRGYLPDYAGAGADRVTIHHLLNHTSGIENFDRAVTSYQQAIESGIEQYQKPHTPDALLRRCCSGPLATQPGAAFSYNNADYIVLGKIVERVTGKPFDAVLRERITEPLGLRSTGMLRHDTVLDRLASTYFYRDDTRTLVNDLPMYVENWYAAGGMYSTTSDLLVFANALFGGDRLLRPVVVHLSPPRAGVSRGEAAGEHHGRQRRAVPPGRRRHDHRAAGQHQPDRPGRVRAVDRQPPDRPASSRGRVT